tara:strand:+ start:32 stop:241 length:210 start_codon:yes stop_codon:yes gene_type:complete
MTRQFFNIVTGNDQTTRRAVNPAEFSFCRHNTFESFAHFLIPSFFSPKLTILMKTTKINIDKYNQYIMS